MPELPEVETITNALRDVLPGRKLAKVETSGKPLRQPLPDAESWRRLAGASFREVRRRGRYIVIQLDHGRPLIFHLGMTGSLRLEMSDAPWRTHDHLRMSFADGEALVYNDPRRFGFVVISASGSLPELRGLGVEPLSKDFTAAYLWSHAARRRQAVKLLLMDNAVVVGVGNIYASEALFAAGIHPATPASSLPEPACRSLVAAVRKVLRSAIAAGGTTIRDFRGLGGGEGLFVRQLKVYGRAGERCSRCRRGVVGRITIGGRSSFFCPECQR